MTQPATHHPDPPALEMRGVSAASMRNQSVIVVQDVDWTIKAGEFWVLGAPQRSGKTDFLMMAGGISAPAAGEYFLLGERMPIFEEPRLLHRLKLGFVFDGGQLIGTLTVAENIALPLRYHRHFLSAADIDARVRELLRCTELEPWADSMPGNLGRSWQQRAGLARALALQPDILLLDSSLTGLEQRHITWWLGFLDELSRGHKLVDSRPMTLLATADDLRPWRKHAQYVACLANKRLLVLGDWKAVEKSPDPVVRELLRDPIESAEATLDVKP